MDVAEVENIKLHINTLNTSAPHMLGQKCIAFVSLVSINGIALLITLSNCNQPNKWQQVNISLSGRPPHQVTTDSHS